MLLGLSIVKNESDVIEAMIRHNLGYLDHMHFIDNGSTDGTTEILAALERETGRVSHEIDNHLGFRQQDSTNRVILEMGARHDPRMILPLDADEFIKGDPESFRHQCMTSETPLHYWWETYIPRPEDDWSEPNPVKRMRHRRRVESPAYMKVTIPGGLIGQVLLEAGSHGLRWNKKEGGPLARKKERKQIPSREFDGIKLAHYPIRTRGQAFAKVMVGTWNLKLRGVPRDATFNWHDIAIRIFETGRFDDEMFYESANTYAASVRSDLVEDPLVSPGMPDLAYSPFVDDGGVEKIIRYTEEVVQRYAQRPPKKTLPKPLRRLLSAAQDRRNRKTERAAVAAAQGAAAPASFPLPIGTRIVPTRFRDKPVNFCVTHPHDELQRHHLRGVFYEEEELAAIAEHVAEGSVFLDIGSNVGNHAVYVGLFCAPSRIIVIEPNTDIIPTLRTNLMLNGLSGICDTSHLGLGLGEVSSSNFGISWRHETWNAGNLGGAQLSEGGGSIQVRRGDDLLAGQTIDFIKMDVEGMEMSALAGLEQVISANRPRMFVEVDNVNIERMKTWLEAHDYDIAGSYSRYPENVNYLCLPR